ncbi:hypothetical protein B0H19DRAFT_1182621 [Mycena capillaripes]|nr:hypothetical protein B0H19DRAFT_1182621 [Mycena capillaripes]
MLAVSRCSTQACRVMISLSIRRLNSDHRDSAFRGFDVYVGATTVTLLNIGNGGIPKNTCQFGGLISFSVLFFFLSVGSGGSIFWLFWGLTFYTDFLFPPIFLRRYQRLFCLVSVHSCQHMFSFPHNTDVFSVQISFCLRSLFALGACFFLLFILLSFTGFGLQILGMFFTLYVWYICGLLPRDVKCALHCGGADHRNTTHTTSGEIVISL